MILDELIAIYNPWVLFQQPVHPTKGVNASFRTLLAALDEGWRVVEPVQVFSSVQQETWTYFWVLNHPGNAQTSVLFMPVTQDVDDFIEQNHYQVIESRYYR